jgi:hypothetical protein
MLDRVSALVHGLGAGATDENSAHDVGADGEEVGAILPLDILHVDEAQKGFVDEGGGLKGVSGSFLTHVAAGQAVQLLVDAGGELLEGFLIPAAPGLQELCDPRFGVLRSRIGLPARKAD